MGSFPAILIATIPVFLVIGLGALFRAKAWWPESADAPVVRLAINVLYPALIAQHVIGNPVLANKATLLWAAGLGFSVLIVTFSIGLLAARLLGLKRGAGARTFAVCSGLQNYGFLPIPIIAAIFPADEATRLLGVLFLFNLGLEIAIWTVGVGLLRGKIDSPLKHLINMPILTIVVCTTITLAGWSDTVPEVLRGTFALLGPTAIPINLFLVGLTLYSVSSDTAWRSTWNITLAACGLRFLVYPMLFLAAATLLPVSVDLQRNLIIQGAMPAGTFVVVLARHYGGHAPTAGQIVIATSLVGLLATPLLLSFGLRWIA